MIDLYPKVCNLCGGPVAKIADELRVTERAVYAHLQKMKEENNGSVDSAESKRD